jgi:uncharacterized low-complexity protein
MSEKYNSKPLALVLGSAMAATLAGVHSVNASENPFSMSLLPGGYLQVAEGKCGEGRCGAKTMSTGAAAEAGVTEGKCGEGKCGMRQMDADGDGKVTREEFMQGHETMFTIIDANGDGVIDAEERAAHRAGKAGGCKMEGKDGGAK